MTLTESVSSIFRSKFEKSPLLFIAPGRINLIGEHTDYNDGFCMPAAIDKHFVFAIAPNGTNQFNLYASDFDASISFEATNLKKGPHWYNYLMGVVHGIQQRGHVMGVDCVFGGNIPPGAGLSSSAALCSGFGFALNEIFKLGLTRLDIARIAQSAEHHFVGLMCGIMDQYSSLFGKEDEAMLLDCRSITHTYLPFHFDNIEIILVDSKVKHELASTAYNDRREACEQGVKIVQLQNPDVRSLRDVTRKMLLENKHLMGEEIFQKCLFIIEEIDRTQRAALYLTESNLSEFGKLMFEAHLGISKLYEVSCDELDVLVQVAQANSQGVIGARMMGGGFGGCTINLVKKSHVNFFKEEVLKQYFATFKKEPDFHLVKISTGIHQLD
ncbi:MAG TPA: galactokinase [Cyclobacteriaceae bacterium]|jgi:galactokinase|nr:galactokinase [Cyclobacteriaceae bacterium]